MLYHFVFFSIEIGLRLLPVNKFKHVRKYLFQKSMSRVYAECLAYAEDHAMPFI